MLRSESGEVKLMRVENWNSKSTCMKIRHNIFLPLWEYVGIADSLDLFNCHAIHGVDRMIFSTFYGL